MVPASSLTRAIVLSGPTATGKTALVLEFARSHPEIEIINADSLLVYRGLDIGTAKPSLVERAGVPHHLIDVRDPDQTFTAGDFVRSTEASLEDISSRGKRALIVGGTGFYLKALLHGLWEGVPANPERRRELEAREQSELYTELLSRDETAALRIGANDRYRLVRAIELLEATGKTPTELQSQHSKEVDPRFELWCVDRSNLELEVRIRERAQSMLAQGLIEETRKIREQYPQSRTLLAVGYAQVVTFLDGKSPPGRKVPAGEPGLLQEIVLGTRQLVKKQRTWFKSQTETRWFQLDADRDRLRAELERFYS